MSVLTINENNFDAEVTKADKPVLIDLWAPWCIVCRMISPAIEKVAEAHPEVKVCKINVDDEPELAKRFQVSVIPALVLMRNGEVKKKSAGFKLKAQIESMIRSNS